jgi:NADH-quinone oxidoreductase subunit C
MTSTPATDEREWAQAFEAVAATDVDGIAMLDVLAARWFEVVEAAQRSGLVRWEFLTGIDEGDGTFSVVVHLLGGGAVEAGSPSVTALRSVFLRTRVVDGEPLNSLVDLFPGAAWHEREAAEMFGIAFHGPASDGPASEGAAPEPLLLGPESPEHPMLKSSWLPRRQNRPWPGAKEPGESDRDLDGGAAAADSSSPAAPRRARRRQTTFGVQPPEEARDG